MDEFRLRSLIYQQHFGRHIPPDKNARILDIGCGDGSIVWWLQQSGYGNANGIDISKEQVERGKALGVRNIECADLTQHLEQNRGAFDAIIARDVIEHFSKEDIYTVLRLCVSALKEDGGIILLQVPNAESPFFGRIRYGDFTHETAFCSSSISQLMSMAGVRHVRYYSCGPVYLGLKSLLRLIAWRFVEFLYKSLLYAELGASKDARIVTQNIIAVAVKAGRER